MAIMHVSSTGSNTSPYDTFAKAATTLLVATAAQVADNDIHVLNTHTETSPGSVTYTLKNNVNVYSTDASGVYDITSKPVISATTGANDTIRVTPSAAGEAVCLHGINLQANSSINLGAYNISGTIDTVDCIVGPNKDGQGGSNILGYSGEECYNRNMIMEINAQYAFFIAFSGGENLTLDNVSFVINGVYSRDVFTIGNTSSLTVLNIINSDLTALPSSIHLLRGLNASSPILKCNIHDCKINPSIVVNPSTITNGTGYEIDIKSCDIGGGYHYYHRYTPQGEVAENLVTYLNYKYDGISSSSALFNSNARATIAKPLKFKLCELPAQDLSANDTTYRVNLLLDTDTVSTLSDTECFVELTHQSNAALAQGKVASSRNTDILAVGTELTVSSETWLGTLPTNTKAYQIDITLTAAQLANVTNSNVGITLCLAVANADVYVCPSVQIGT